MSVTQPGLPSAAITPYSECRWSDTTRHVLGRDTMELRRRIGLQPVEMRILAGSRMNGVLRANYGTSLHRTATQTPTAAAV